MDTAIISKRQWKKREKRTSIKEKKPDVVLKFIAAFQNDFSVQEACDYVGIGRTAFYEWIKKDPEFAEEMEKAKRFPMLRAKQRGFEIIDKGSDRDAGPMVRWLLEKRQPEIYGLQQAPAGNNTQNNYFFLNNGQLSDITKQPDIANSDPSELLKALETTSNVDTRAKEESPA